MNDKPAPCDEASTASVTAQASPSPLPQGWTGGPPDTDAFFHMAEAALASLPPLFQPYIQNLLTIVEDVADADTLRALGIDNALELTGLYEGYPLTERSLDHSGQMPDRVTLYRIPILMEWVDGGERLDWLIRHVMIHEIGHHFGFSDDDMHALEAMSMDPETPSQDSE